LARAVIGFVLYSVVVPGMLFVAAGDTAWPMGWLYVALYVVASFGGRLVALRTTPELLKERAAALTSRDVPAWDRPLVLVVAMVGPMAGVIVAGLDHRFAWPPPLPPAATIAGAALVAAGYLLSVWAMLANPFFSSLVRIQTDRGHRVIAAGPYRMVRHPAYAGGLLAAVGAPLMLDAVWAFVPSIVMAAALVLRTALEDRLLRDRLPGYAEYATTVRARLAPGVW
jgi:protein-S-isoprenylcysteine O-methyltransferase Ste14